ncbi:hypothetical protein [Candidatus Nitrospira bockiana]
MVTPTADRTRTTSEDLSTLQGLPSLDEWVIGVLRQQGTQTLDQLGKLLPEANWAQLFLAIDRLSRSGSITLWSPGFGDYLISVNDGQN